MWSGFVCPVFRCCVLFPGANWSILGFGRFRLPTPGPLFAKWRKPAQMYSFLAKWPGLKRFGARFARNVCSLSEIWQESFETYSFSGQNSNLEYVSRRYCHEDPFSTEFWWGRIRFEGFLPGCAIGGRRATFRIAMLRPPAAMLRPQVAATHLRVPVLLANAAHAAAVLTRVRPCRACRQLRHACAPPCSRMPPAAFPDVRFACELLALFASVVMLRVPCEP